MRAERTQRKHAMKIFRAALRAADPSEAILRNVRVDGDRVTVGTKRYDLRRFRRVYAVGAGKASARMAQAVEKLLGKRLTGGNVNVKYGHTEKLRRIRLNECGHPVPDEAGVRGTEAIAQLASDAGADDLVLCLISGGGSALLPLPAKGITLDGKQETTRLLLASGANIHEINTIRKHISVVKGGQLARMAYPATVVSLILSDVIGDDLDVIASGITAPDRSTFADARSILERYALLDRVPKAVRERIDRGCAGDVEETPKADDPAFERTQNVIVGSNKLALNAAAETARALGYRTLVLSSFIEGETRDVARVHAAIAKEIHASRRPLRAPACLISGGETTVTLRGEGKGGRNQEFALAAALDVARMQETLVMSCGTDGTDGPTDAAGALCTGETVERAAAKGLSARAHLDGNDAYPFFDALGDLVRTGATGTNVMDVRLVLVGAPG